MLTALMPVLALVATASASDGPHVRANGDPTLAALLQTASTRSETFKRLVSRIDETDGIVYVENGRCGHAVRACLVLTVHVAGSRRILRILVDTARDRDELIAAVGHELQHGIEALTDAHVVDDITIYNFFQRIAPTDKGRFETDAAIQVGLDVLADLRRADGHGNRADGRQEPPRKSRQ
jgi:hypothetical protein